MNKNTRKPRPARIYHALITFVVLVAAMAVGIMVYHVDVHIPMFVGVIAAACMALFLGYDWETIETAMKDGIYNALQAVIILAIVGILVGVWILGGVVPAMIYYGLKLLSPSIFLVAAMLICSITSLATGTAWGTLGTMGLALMGIAAGLDIPAPMAAGAIISGAYFGDKMSPLSDTTNLAPAMAGTDVFTHVKFMILPTAISYGISLVLFIFLGFTVGSANGDGMDMSAVQQMSDSLETTFRISPVLLLPPLIVIVSVALHVPAIPGITLGIISGAVIGIIVQPAATFGGMLDAGMNGFASETGIEAIDALLSSGGLTSMMNSISLTILAMMFGGIMERTGQLDALVSKIVHIAKTPASLVVTTEATCILSNALMPEQYISIVVPGRMYAEVYREKGLHPKTLSNALESAGTVSSALIPWNTCGVYILGVLGVSTLDYFPYAFFNLLMPIVVAIMAYIGITVADKDGRCLIKSMHRKKQA